MPRLFANPRRLRRYGHLNVAFAAALAGAAAAWRARGGPNGTYLFDVAAWLLAVGGAVSEARVGTLLFGFAPVPARRRALLLTLLGLLTFLLSCVLYAVGSADNEAIRGVAGAALIGGIGLGLGGLFTLAAYYGGDYAASRIERMDDT
ncbi:MAG: hypothetical protein ACRDJH_24625 [Thermomicrobiales bacterium]